MNNRIIFLIDMQSFYANLEKLAHPLLTGQPVVVAGDPSIRSGVILAACPTAKSYGIQTAEPIWQARNKCAHVHILKPHMQFYVDVSVTISTFLEQYSTSVEPYSIDEVFLDFPFMSYEKAELLARHIKQRLLREIGVQARIGIGSTKVYAKMACDHFAKENKTGTAVLWDANVSEQLWPLPIKKLFSVGSRMEAHLLNMGIRTIGQLARYPLQDLKKRWGINGELFWQTAHGRDASPVSSDTHQKRKSIGHHMTLPRDYYHWSEIKVVLRELSEEVSRRCRQHASLGQVVSAGAVGQEHGFPRSFQRQQRLFEPTNSGKVIFETASSLFKDYWDGTPIRSLGISLSVLQPDEYKQLNLFNSEEHLEMLYHTIDQLKDKYGMDAVLYASSLSPAGQAVIRARKIGGHYK